MTNIPTFKCYISISERMQKYNQDNKLPKLNFYDYILLCLIRSYYEQQQNCDLTIKELADYMMVCERTINYSIKRLQQAGMIERQGKELVYKYI